MNITNKVVRKCIGLRRKEYIISLKALLKGKEKDHGAMISVEENKHP